MKMDSDGVTINGHHPAGCRQHPAECATPFYCDTCQTVTCHRCLEEGLHMGHNTTTSQEVISVKRQELEEVLNDLEEETCRLRWLKERADLFELSYEECNSLIHKTAESLICKIRDHEQRLLDEIAVHRQTEYRKLGCTREVLQQNCEQTELLQKQGQMVLTNDGQADKNYLYSLKTITQTINTSLENNDHLGDNENAMAKIYFCPVRCNTAFGTIDTTEPSGTPPRSWSREPSISPRLSPQNMSPISTLSPPANFNNTKQHNSRFLNKFPLAPLNGMPSLENGLRVVTGKKQRRCSLQVQHSPMQSPKNPCPSIFSSPLPELFSPLTLAWEVNTEGTACGQVNCPNDVTFLQDDVVAVSDRDNQRVQLFSAQGKFIKVIGQGKIKPRRVTRTREGHIALTDSKDNCVKIYDTTGHLVASWGKKRFKCVFKAPCGIAVNSRGQFIVSDMERHTVTIHQADGKTVKYLGGNGHQGDFQSPSYIFVNDKDDIFVSDNCSHHVKVFDKDGNFLSQFSKFDTEESHLKYPNGVCTDELGNIFVADWGNHLVTQFAANGDFSRHLLTRNDNLYHPAGIAVQNGYLALSEYSDNHSSVRLYRL